MQKRTERNFKLIPFSNHILDTVRDCWISFCHYWFINFDHFLRVFLSLGIWQTIFFRVSEIITASFRRWWRRVRTWRSCKLRKINIAQFLFFLWSEFASAVLCTICFDEQFSFLCCAVVFARTCFSCLRGISAKVLNKQIVIRELKFSISFNIFINK